MTVFGVGLDVVDTASFGRQLADEASGFVAATFTPAERRAVPTDQPRRVSALAARFAAKEAFLKAWSSTRWGQAPALPEVDLRHIEVVEDGFGRPALRLHGAVAAAMNDAAAMGEGAAMGEAAAADDLAAMGEGAVPPDVHISLSHDGPIAAAVVVLAAR